MTGRQFTYAFDPIGNRDSYQIDTGTPTTYVDNALNQYDRTTNGTTYEGFGYDADGNMTSDGTTTYEWDAENRLIAQYPTNHSANKIVWTYDYMNRRVWRRGYAWDANLNQYKSGTDTAFERKFLFDGWNNIMILDGKASDAPNRSHTWGLDLSGLNGAQPPPAGSSSIPGMHAAGGIGGLLSELAQWDSSNRKFIYCYDANGNVGQLLAVADGSIASSYEYEPFGKPVVVTDPGNSGNSYFFSTRLLVNDLYYSSRRYENWRLGRWMSRDPMEELGGSNLLSFVNNRPTDQVDSFGLEPAPNSPSIDGEVEVGTVSGTMKFCNRGASVSFSAAVYANRTGQLRLRYTDAVAALQAAGLSKEAGECARDALQAEFKDLQTEFGRQFSNAWRAAHPKKIGAYSRANETLSGWARKTCKISKCCMVLSIGVEVAAVWSYPPNERPAEIGRAAGRFAGAAVGTWAGAWAGGKCGAAIGACAGPWGAAAGAVGGGIVGACCGEWAVDAFAELLEHPPRWPPLPGHTEPGTFMQWKYYGR